MYIPYTFPRTCARVYTSHGGSIVETASGEGIPKEGGEESCVDERVIRTKGLMRGLWRSVEGRGQRNSITRR